MLQIDRIFVFDFDLDESHRKLFVISFDVNKDLRDHVLIDHQFVAILFKISLGDDLLNVVSGNHEIDFTLFRVELVMFDTDPANVERFLQIRFRKFVFKIGHW